MSFSLFCRKMAELSCNFSLTGSGKITFSLNFEPSSSPCENLTVSDPDPTTTSDLSIVRSDLASCPTDTNERLGTGGNVGSPGFDNLSDFGVNDFNLALLGADWLDFCGNDVVENPPVPLIDERIVYEGEGTVGEGEGTVGDGEGTVGEGEVPGSAETKCELV
jgi:hypothetical protein